MALRPVHQQIADRFAVGELYADIAKAVGMSYGGVRSVLAREEVQAEVDRIVAMRSRQLRNKLRGIADVAISTLQEVAADETAPHAARVTASVAILDRVGLGREQVLQVAHQPEYVDPVARLGRVAAMLSGTLLLIPDGGDQPIDVEAEPADDDGDDEGGAE